MVQFPTRAFDESLKINRLWQHNETLEIYRAFAYFLTLNVEITIQTNETKASKMSSVLSFENI